MDNPFGYSGFAWHRIDFQLNTWGAFQRPVQYKSLSADQTMGSSNSAESAFVDEKAAIETTDEAEDDWNPPDSIVITAEITSDNQKMDTEKVEASF